MTDFVTLSTLHKMTEFFTLTNLHKMTDFVLRRKILKIFGTLVLKKRLRSAKVVEKFLGTRKLWLYSYLNYKVTQNDSFCHTYSTALHKMTDFMIPTRIYTK